MTLDDLAEINRLTELIGNIRSGNPPSYFISLREAEVHNIRRVILQRLNNTQEQEAFYSRDSAGKELEEIFDTNQIKLIQAKINSIRGAALEQEENITDDGPSGQEVH
jgi:flagellar biosynthesis/type III secretory pathway chaperone